MQNHKDPGTPRFSTPQKTWTFPLNASQLKWPNAQNMKLIISSDFLFVPNILSFPSITWADKPERGYKVLEPKHGSSAPHKR